MKTIVVISELEEWERARQTGCYARSTIDSTLEEVGFIHCSSPHQTMDILKRHFADRENPVLLYIDAVFAVVSLEKNDQGEFVVPSDLLLQL